MPADVLHITSSSFFGLMFFMSWLLLMIAAGMRGLRYVVQNLLQIRNRVHC